ncbi:hypothetical protein, partial [Mesorhizobium sp. M1A.F.Ca.IN.022.05.2.1]|uniref:hypothetical protein n=2 Tax=unclassified Mesorhizobium TaxID=325217 RepID=UPI0019D033C1
LAVQQKYDRGYVESKPVKSGIIEGSGAMTIVDRLRACWGFSPNVDRNVALVDGFLNGKTVAELAQEHRLSKTRTRQIIEKADRLVGGSILTRAEPSEAPPRSDFMAAYPYVWSLAETHRLGSVAPHHFFKELQRAGSLEQLVDRIKRYPKRAPLTSELIRLVWLKETGESPWPAMKRSKITIAEPGCAADHPDRGLHCQRALAMKPAIWMISRTAWF